MGKLTAVAANAASKPDRYQDGEGLQLLVKPSGTKSWILWIQAKDNRRGISLGSAVDVTLRDAREKADEIRRMYRRGSDVLQNDV
jgi:Arm DNA-binding domain